MMTMVGDLVKTLTFSLNPKSKSVKALTDLIRSDCANLGYNGIYDSRSC